MKIFSIISCCLFLQGISSIKVGYSFFYELNKNISIMFEVDKVGGGVFYHEDYGVYLVVSKKFLNYSYFDVDFNCLLETGPKIDFKSGFLKFGGVLQPNTFPFFINRFLKFNISSSSE